jgi:hypothetical protein
MSVIKMSLIAAALAVTLANGAVVAQTTTAAEDARAAASKASDAASKAADDVAKWSKKQWNAAKAKWSQEQTKWDACNKKAADQKLTGRKSWSFIADCMSS